MLQSFVRAVCLPGALWMAFVSSAAYAQPGGFLTQVAVVPAQQREVSSTLSLVGSVGPYTRSVIASELAGLVQALDVKEGDRLEAGATICRLRDTTHRLALDEATGRLQQLQAQLDELEAGSRPEEIEQTRAAMEEAKAILEKWEEEHKRVLRLREQSSASLKEFNDVAAEYSAGKERLARTKAAYEMAVAGPRKEEIARARFAVAAQKAVVAKLQYDLDQTVIRTPFTGYITQKLTEVGQWVSAGGPVVEMIALDRVLVRVDVPESAISAAKVGAVVGFSVDALGRMFEGRIERIIPQADVRARTFPVDVVVANDEHLLKCGMFVRARMPSGQAGESVVVPRDAVLHRQGTDLVVIVGPAPQGGQGEFATPIPVQLGAYLDGWVAVTSPALQAGMPVAVKGHDRIFGPQPVMSVPAAGIPTSAPAGGTTTQPVAARH